MKNLVSIDTGKKGAAVLWRGNEPLDVYLFEEWEDGIDSNAFDRQLSTWRQHWGSLSFAIERVPTLPNQSVKTTAKQFTAVGQTYAICMIHTIDPIIDFYPMTWVSLAKKLSEPQSRSLAAKKLTQIIAKRMFPEICKKHTKRVKCHDGVVDALMIGVYAKRDHFAQFVSD